MYVIAHPAGVKRPSLFRTRRSGDKLLGVVPDHTQYGETASVVLKATDIVVSLGDNPPYGTVYGVLVEPIEDRLLIRGYGEVFVFIHRMQAAIKERVMRAFPAALSRVKALGPACDWEVRTEVRNPKGTILGNYNYRPRDQDVLVLRPIEGQGTKEMVRVIAHEWGHGVWHRHMDSSARARWIRLYDRYVSVKTVPVRDIQSMIRDMRQIDGIRPFLKDAEPEQQSAAMMYLGWMKKVHGIDTREVQDLLSSGGEMPIPDTHLHRSDVQTPITLYSKSSAPELFCEAFCSKIVGDLSDRRIDAMLRELRA